MAYPRGKEIFENRVEYPLVKKAGLRDYIFYLVPAGDQYGKSARAFFSQKLYPNHHRHDVSSLEQIIEVLAAEPAGSKIRELVIVAHASPAGLLHRLRTAASESTTPEYRYIKPETLALLQQDFERGEFSAFKAKRAQAIARFDNESWITLRACRFGSSQNSMYALYSFFGGRPNVYAPKDYQFFGVFPIIEEMRLQNRLEVHHHLTRQRFLPKDVHTPDRKDRIVRALIEPGRFKEPFVLASLQLAGAPPNEKVAYEAMIDSLDKGRLADVRPRFIEAGQTLSSKAFSRIRERNRAWTVLDEATHERGKYKIEYLINEEFDDQLTHASITVSPRLMTTPRGENDQRALSQAPRVAIQLFLDNRENDEFHGHIADVASYSDDPAGQQAGKADFDAVVTVLERKQLANDAGSAVIVEAFDRALQVTLPLSTVIQEVERKVSGSLTTVTWAVQHDKRYLVKLGHLDDTNGYMAHRVSIFHAFNSKDERLLYEWEKMATIGDDPDTPGVELQAYFDRFSIDELTEVIDHLRSAYRPAHSFYIAEAMSAMKRKREHFTWWLNKYGQAAAEQPLLAQPYATLESNEIEDMAGQVYGLDFNGTWSEVKASHPQMGVFVNDLFAEEDLLAKLGYAGAPDRNQRAVLGEDAATNDIEELRELEAAGVEDFFAREKNTYEPVVADEPAISCEELATIFAKYKELAQAGDVEELKRQLGALVASDKKSYLDHVLIVVGLVGLGTKLWQVVNVSGTHTPALVEKIVLYRVLRLPSTSALGTAGIGNALFTAMIPISIGWFFWSKYIHEVQQAESAWEALGKRTYIRQWLRELIKLTSVEPFPSSVDIDLRQGDPLAHVSRYLKELRDSGRYDLPFIYAADRMKKGFEAGELEMKFQGPEILRRADAVVDQVLRENNLDACKLKVLRDVGIFDIDKMRAILVRSIAQALLAKIPNV